jgi:CRP-like cAMP-binding protein
MYKEEWINRLSITPLFHDIKYKKINRILDYSNPRVKKYKKHEVVTFSGQSYDGIGIVASGKIAITRESPTGNRIILDILKAGDIFGEMVAFSDNKEWPLTIVSQEDTCLFFLLLDKFVGDYNNTSICRNIIILNLLKILSDYTISLNKKIDYLTEKNLRNKLTMYLMDMYKRYV